MKQIIAWMLICLMLLCCGCGGDDGAAAADPQVTPTPVPDVPAAPVTVVTTPQPGTAAETVDMTVKVHGEEEVIPMTAVSGSFAAAGGPDFTLLVDTQRYLVNDVGGYCYITLYTGMSGDVYVELGFRENTNPRDIGTEILDEYGDMSSKEDLGEEWLGGNHARHLRGRTVQNIFDLYLIDTEQGCFTAVMSSTSETKAHSARLQATLESLELFE